MPSFDSLDPDTCLYYTRFCEAFHANDVGYERNYAFFNGRDALTAFVIQQNDARLHDALNNGLPNVLFLIRRSWCYH